jgi:2,4-dienoyl-CoA reductase-like NADH-dependent reductase (Old Yellow Enzyme family)
MSRFFHYRSADELGAAALALSLPIRLSADTEVLLQPAIVDGRVVGNRLAIHPMEGCDAEPDGAPGELTRRRYLRFGAGGAKLIWMEACAVVPEGRANTRQLLLNQANAQAIAALLHECREAHRFTWGTEVDLLVGLQLTHSGRYSHPRPILVQHDPILDVRTIVDKIKGSYVRPGDPLITDDDLCRLQDKFVAAAHLAFQIGFDFVDIKQCHRYLLNELLAARRRPGRFGGSFENRTRFAREVFGRIRAESPHLVLATRLNVFDGLPFSKGGEDLDFESDNRPLDTCWGTNSYEPHLPSLDEPIAYLRLLEALGVSLVSVTMGNPYASPHLLRPFEYPPPDGYESPENPLIGVARHFELTEKIQRAFPKITVVGSGYSYLQGYALNAGAANIEDGRATFVGLGRASLAQPDFAGRLIKGMALDPKHTCRTFSYCTALMRAKHNELGQFATGCPPFDKEVYGPLWKAAGE